MNKIEYKILRNTLNGCKICTKNKTNQNRCKINMNICKNTQIYLANFTNITDNTNQHLTSDKYIR